MTGFAFDAPTVIRTKRDGGRVFDAAIEWVIDDGTFVKQGQRLIEMDGSAVKEQLKTQRMMIEQKIADRILAEEDLKITRLMNETDLRVAEVDLQVRELDLQNVPANDTYQKQIQGAKVELARMTLKRVREQRAKPRSFRRRPN